QILCPHSPPGSELSDVHTLSLHDSLPIYHCPTIISLLFLSRCSTNIFWLFFSSQCSSTIFWFFRYHHPNIIICRSHCQTIIIFLWYHKKKSNKLRWMLVYHIYSTFIDELH